MNLLNVFQTKDVSEEFLKRHLYQSSIRAQIKLTLVCGC